MWSKPPGEPPGGGAAFVVRRTPRSKRRPGHDRGTTRGPRHRRDEEEARLRGPGFRPARERSFPAYFLEKLSLD